MLTRLHFEDLRFVEEGRTVKVFFLKTHYFVLSKRSLEEIAPFHLEEGDIIFQEREKRVRNKFNLLLDVGLKHLVHRVRHKPTLYIHQGLGLPLIGTNEFGLVDRGSNIIEVKPLTGCNLSCSFCSVNEGVNNKTDILVEKNFLLKSFAQLAATKEHPVEANIGPQGEPLLYPDIVGLVFGLKEGGAAVVSINTNGTLLNKKLIDDLAGAGLDRINLSVHALKQEKANELMGGVVLLDRLKEMIAYCENKIDVLLTPVLIPGHNDDELDGLIEFSKSIHNRRWPSIGIQNFLEYPGGRNPGVKSRSWDEFFKILKAKEKKHGVRLIVKENIFGMHSDKSLEKPFHKGDVISVVLLAKGRNDRVMFASASQRAVSVKNCSETVGKTIKVKLLRDKHNIFTAVPVKEK